MVLLLSFVAAELFLILGVALYIDGRRPRPSPWIRNEFLFAIAANAVVAMLLGAVAGLGLTLSGWWSEGVHVSHPWAIAASVVIAWAVLRSLLPAVRRISEAALAAAAAALPQAEDLVVPPARTPGNGPLAG